MQASCSAVDAVAAAVGAAVADASEYSVYAAQVASVIPLNCQQVLSACGAGSCNNKWTSSRFHPSTKCAR
eukprot:4143801-Alexandrium_andersonii.AAC.1